MTNVIEYVLIIFAFITLMFLAIDKRVSDNKKEQDAYNQQLEECFKQEPRTTDCEFVLWKYEIKNGCKK